MILMSTKIAELAALTTAQKSIDVTARCIYVSEAKEVQTNNGPTQRATAFLVDLDADPEVRGAKLNLTLWGDQIARVGKPVKTVKVSKGYLTIYKGKPQLSVGKYGKLTVVED